MKKKQDKTSIGVDAMVSNSDTWFANNLKCLLGGQITLIKMGKQKKIKRERLARWILKNC